MRFDSLTLTTCTSDSNGHPLGEAPFEPPPLGEAPFYSDTGRVLLALSREGSFRVKLQASTVRPDGRKLLNLTEMTLNVRLPDTYDPDTREKRGCSGHGVVTEDEGGRQNGQYRCICTGRWQGHDCDTPITADPLLTITGVTQDPEMTQALGYTRYAGDIVGEDQSGQHLTTPDRVMWAVGVRYRLPALNITTTSTDNSAVGFKLFPNPSGFFVNGETAEAIGVPGNSSAFFEQPRTVTAYAVAEGFADTELGTIIFEYRYADSDANNPSFAANGPRNRTCENNATAVEGAGASEFDGAYECACVGGYSGPNCDIAPPTATSSAASAATDTVISGVDDRLLIGGAGGALLLLVATVLITTRVKLYRLKHRPVDVGMTQDEVLASLGLAATTDIGIGEFGISLHFHSVFGHSPDGWVQFKVDLVAALRKAAPQIKVAQQQQHPARIIIGSAGTSRVLVVIPKAKSPQPPEAVAELLAAKAAKGALVVGDGHRRVVDASVAVPRQVPREVPRSALTRLKLLGEGAFGAVHQYQLDERSMPAYFVAAKSIRAGKSSGSADARDALLREAALGALLDHRNVVATIGVTTAPRNVPALLLLSFCAEGTLEALAAAASPATMSTAERLTYCAQTLQGLQYIASIRIVHRDVAARNVLLDSTMTCKVRARACWRQF